VTENHMHQNERERQRHRSHYRSGLQPSPVIRNTPWGEAPCTAGPNPRGLKARPIPASGGSELL
jgi:hypothetical protein